MSRPFSYNDENFTVINNILICHIKIKNDIIKSEPIIEVPPEIYRRLITCSNVGWVTRDKINTTSSYATALGIKVIGNKSYIICSGAIKASEFEYITCIYMLKDI